MIIFKDCVSEDEMFTDTYKYTVRDDVFYEVHGKMTTEKTDINEAAIGANASAEEATDEGGAEASVQKGVDIVLANRLVQTAYSKKDFRTYIKGYMANVVKHLEQHHPERVAAFKAAAQKAVKDTILAKFDDWDFFMGESMKPEGGLGLLGFREDGITPYMLFFKDGLLEEKA